MGCLYQRGTVWWVKFYRGGRPFYESSRSANKSVADRLLKKREGEVADGRFVGTRQDLVRFENLAEDLLNDYRMNRRRSLPQTERAVKRLGAFFRGRRAVDITTADVRRYIAERQSEYVRPPCPGHKGEERCPKCEHHPASASVQLELSALKRMFSLGVQAGQLHRAPYVPRLRVDNARKGFLGDIEYLAVRAALREPLRPVLDFAFATAWRKREILGLTWDRVDFTAGTVRLDTSKTYQGRVVALAEDLKATLHRLRDETVALEAKQGIRIPWVFHRNGKPIKSIDGAWRSARTKAGLPGLYFHDLRRTGVRNLVRSGVPEAVAMRISGHKTRAIFDRYNIVSESDLHEAARKVAARFHGEATVTETVTVPTESSTTEHHSGQDAGEGDQKGTSRK